VPNYTLKLLLLLNAWLQNPLLVNFIRASADAKFIWTKARTWLEVLAFSTALWTGITFGKEPDWSCHP